MKQKQSSSLKINFVVLALLLVVVLFGFYLVGGIFPTKLNTANRPFETQSYTLITPKAGSSNKALQLKPIEFKSCSTTTAVNFLVDRSGSMEWGEKLPLLKKGILTLAGNLSDESIFGLQTYSDNWREDITPDSYGNVKDQIIGKVCNIIPNGATHSKSAFERTREVIKLAKEKNPDHLFTLIFISDGIPETGNTNKACPGGMDGEWCGPMPNYPGACRCFAQEEDPTPIAKELINMGVTIYTIAYVEKEDQKLDSKLQEMMKRVASSPENYFKAPDEKEVIDILKKISQEICTN